MNIKTNYTLLRKLKETHDHESTVRLLRSQPIQEGSNSEIGKLLHFLLQLGQMKDGSNKTSTTERFPLIIYSGSFLAGFAFFLGGRGSNGNMRYNL